MPRLTMGGATRRALARSAGLGGGDRSESIPALRGPTPAPPGFVEEVERFEDVEQGSDEWFRLRLGMPTASVFHTVMASGVGGGDSKTRTKLLYQMAGERLTEEPAENYKNAYMQRGNEMEADARARYAFSRDVELERPGFVRRSLPGGRFVGASPDSLVIGQKRALEIKTMAPHLMIELVQSGRFPSEHRAQCHGTLWVTGYDVVDLVIFYRGMPVTPTFTIERDEIYIRQIAEAVEVFDYELRKLVEKLQNMGRR